MSDSIPFATRDEFGHISWLTGLRRYLIFLVFANLVWEVAQLPLYTIWTDASPAYIAFAALHCTGGDLLIGASSLLGALLIAGHPRWPAQRFWATAIWAIAGGVAYTMFSEYYNTQVRGSWSYRDIMPTLPWIGVGLSPLAQWIVVPGAAFIWLHRRMPTTKLSTRN
jgi:hypothetical protein